MEFNRHGGHKKHRRRNPYHIGAETEISDGMGGIHKIAFDQERTDRGEWHLHVKTRYMSCPAPQSCHRNLQHQVQTSTLNTQHVSKQPRNVVWEPHTQTHSVFLTTTPLGRPRLELSEPNDTIKNRGSNVLQEKRQSTSVRRYSACTEMNAWEKRMDDQSKAIVETASEATETASGVHQHRHVGFVWVTPLTRIRG